MDNYEWSVRAADRRIQVERSNREAHLAERHKRVENISRYREGAEGKIREKGE